MLVGGAAYGARTQQSLEIVWQGGRTGIILIEVIQRRCGIGWMNLKSIKRATLIWGWKHHNEVTWRVWRLSGENKALKSWDSWEERSKMASADVEQEPMGREKAISGYHARVKAQVGLPTRRAWHWSPPRCTMFHHAFLSGVPDVLNQYFEEMNT